MISGFGPTAGAALCSHMDVDKLAFTGSSSTGKIVLGLSAKSNLKPVTLELGGKSPFIVCKDADIDAAVKAAQGRTPKSLFPQSFPVLLPFFYLLFFFSPNLHLPF